MVYNGAKVHILWRVFLLEWIGMTVGLIAIYTHAILMRLIALIALNSFVLCAFKINEYLFFHSIVVIDLFLSFSF